MRLIFSLLLVAVLTACGPTETKYTYSPPQTPGGRMCVNQCRLAKDYCAETCNLTHRGCVADVQVQALKDYDKYTREQYIARGEMDLYLSDFERMQPCTSSRDRCLRGCESDYGMCYANCGGKVSSSSACQFLCF